MSTPAKAELERQLAAAREENAALRDLLAAISEGDAPASTGGHEDADQLARSRLGLVTIWADLDGENIPEIIRARAARAREEWAKPLPYTEKCTEYTSDTWTYQEHTYRRTCALPKGHDPEGGHKSAAQLRAEAAAPREDKNDLSPDGKNPGAAEVWAAHKGARA